MEHLAYTYLADELMEQATKEQLEKVAGILALYVGWYHARYGDVPVDDLLRMVEAETPTDEGEEVLLHGMQNLVSVLSEVMHLRGDEGLQ